MAKAAGVVFVILAVASLAAATSGTCGAPKVDAHDYSQVLASPAKAKGIAFDDLPGFTRSVYQRDYALVTPESRVYATLPGWKNVLKAHVISPASGAHFLMYLADMKADSEAAQPEAGVERFILVLNGELTITRGSEQPISLTMNHWAYFPANDTAKIASANGAGFVAWERVYKAPKTDAVFGTGNVEDSPLLPTPGEVFQLRKLLPHTTSYDFNIHIMDFQPGEYLFTKEVHYNQHGLLLLEGKGIYRLADYWTPVQAGDVIYMGPFVPQWYAALGTTPTRYAIYKDTMIDPLLTPLH